MTISAKLIAASVASITGKALYTFELEYPRMIHAEFMTHRAWSKNAASSRAIPVATAIKLIESDTARPSHWGKNQPGMSAKEQCENFIEVQKVDDAGDFYVDYVSREQYWDMARDAAIAHASKFAAAGYHKQIVNRLIEPYSHIKVVASTTDEGLSNLLHLRAHPDAQPEFQILAQQIRDEVDSVIYNVLEVGEWHVPYFKDGFWSDKNNDDGTTLEDALAISASCCAQVSYRKSDDSLEKARDIYKRLVESTPVHASPFEHQGTPMPFLKSPFHGDWPLGITHIRRDYQLCSGNFVGWIQNRQLIPNNVCERYVPHV